MRLTGYPACRVNQRFYRRFERTGDADRKSTRLNSSHSSTSYAAFCLKKKIYLGITALILFNYILLPCYSRKQPLHHLSLLLPAHITEIPTHISQPSHLILK